MADASNTGFGIGLGVLFFVYLAVILGSVAFMIVALVDIVRRPDWQWRLAHQEKILWLLLVILVNFLAIPSLIYWFSIRKKLVAVDEQAKAGAFGPGHMGWTGWEPGPGPPAPIPPGWHRDPRGQHQLRWWGGTAWSEHVWDGPAASTAGTAGPGEGSTGTNVR